jgi:hypothetical protein
MIQKEVNGKKKLTALFILSATKQTQQQTTKTTEDQDGSPTQHLLQATSKNNW